MSLHAPPEHACVDRSQLQPFACFVPSQLAKPPWQVPVHWPVPVHAAVMCVVEQAVPHAPQLFASV